MPCPCPCTVKLSDIPAARLMLLDRLTPGPSDENDELKLPPVAPDVTAVRKLQDVLRPLLHTKDESDAQAVASLTVHPSTLVVVTDGADVDQTPVGVERRDSGRVATGPGEVHAGEVHPPRV